MIKIESLEVGRKYIHTGGNTFDLFREFDMNKECFRRNDGCLHFGREFVEFENGEPVLDLDSLY